MLNTSSSNIQLDLTSLCRETEQEEQPVYFSYQGKRYVIMTEDDFEYFESLEDERLTRLVKKSRTESGEDIPYNSIQKELGFNPL